MPLSLEPSEEARKLRESIDAVKLHAESLAWLVSHLPEHDHEPVNDSELHLVLELSQDIHTNINRIFILRGRRRAGEVTDAPSREDSIYQWSKDQAQLLKRKKPLQKDVRPWKTRKIRLQCHNCATEDTPKWRSGPAGPGSLCNVCGLMFAKRQHRLRLRASQRCHSVPETG
ncbi:hypothetical protein QQS21_010061 [Conoideocrella luteorostrata]|uniref:GATA-type domain-containing protein n=1 Tax=Conoideocrella luteorostrata TaxID=1105319 RepID=A0AAJ0FX90_9HYPO|nr:hypothetical protein QQS21_010061 [Conoideocrella luteorostrata]